MMRNLKHLLAVCILSILITGRMFAATAPELIQPADKSNCSNTEVDLLWKTAPLADSYSVEVSLSNDFDSPFISEVNITDTTTKIFLTEGTQYWWRVLANYNSSDPKTSEIWSFKTRELAPILVSPETGKRAVIGNEEFTWNGDGDTYCIQISEKPDFSVLFKEVCDIAGEKTVINITEYGKKYYWRVAGINDGCMSDYSTAWSFETPMTGSDLLYPANNTLGFPYFTDMPPFRIEFIWKDIYKVGEFTLEVSETSDFKEILYDFTGRVEETVDSIAQSKKFVWEEADLQLNRRYYWRVRGIDGEHLSQWSETFSFKTPFDGIIGINPSNGDLCTSMNETFIWSQENLAMRYHLQIYKNLELTEILHDIKDIADTVITDIVLDEALTTYYWRVRAEDANNVGYWSPLKSFTTNQAAPILTKPENGATGYELEIELAWDAQDGDLQQIQISTDENFDSLIVDKAEYLEHTYTFTSENYNKLYYWRVRAQHDICTSTWSEVSTFKTTVAAPLLVSPTDAEEGVAFPPRFEWGAVEGAEFYTIEIAKDIDFKENYYNDSYLEGNIIVLPAANFEELTTYFWRVRALSKEGESKWSEKRRFKMGQLNAIKPKLLAPKDNETAVEMPVVFKWDEGVNADSYELEISENKDLSDSLYFTVDKTSFEYNLLSNYTTYYWRLRSKNSMGFSSWTNISKFRTIDMAYAAGPLLTKPANFAHDISLNPQLKWEEELRAKNYLLEVSKKEDLSDPVATDRTTNNYYYLKNLDFETKYFWRVRAFNEAGYGPWSPTKEFTTEKELLTVEEEEYDPMASKVFPNPARETAILSFYTKKNGGVTVKIKSIRGKTVDVFHYSMSRGDHRVQIDVSEYTAGSYVYSIESPEGKQYGKFLVK